MPASLVSHARTRVSGTFVQLGMTSAPVLKNHALWIGPLVTLAGAVSYFAFFARFPALRDFPWVNLPVVLLGLGLSALGLTRAYKRTSSYRGKILGPIGLVVSGLLSSAFVFYIFGLSFWLPEPTRVARGCSETTAPRCGVGQPSPSLLRGKVEQAVVRSDARRRTEARTEGRVTMFLAFRCCVNPLP